MTRVWGGWGGLQAPRAEGLKHLPPWVCGVCWKGVVLPSQMVPVGVPGHCCLLSCPGHARRLHPCDSLPEVSLLQGRGCDPAVLLGSGQGREMPGGARPGPGPLSAASSGGSGRRWPVLPGPLPPLARLPKTHPSVGSPGPRGAPQVLAQRWGPRGSYPGSLVSDAHGVQALCGKAVLASFVGPYLCTVGPLCCPVAVPPGWALSPLQETGSLLILFCSSPRGCSGWPCVPILHVAWLLASGLWLPLARCC